MIMWCCYSFFLFLEIWFLKKMLCFTRKLRKPSRPNTLLIFCGLDKGISIHSQTTWSKSYFALCTICYGDLSVQWMKWNRGWSHIGNLKLKKSKNLKAPSHWASSHYVLQDFVERISRTGYKLAGTVCSSLTELDFIDPPCIRVWWT